MQFVLVAKKGRSISTGSGQVLCPYNCNPQPRISPVCRFFQLAAKLAEIDTMLGGFVLADKDHRNVPSIALLQDGVFINVYFAQCSTRFMQ
jgi:hypothetical protein